MVGVLVFVHEQVLETILVGGQHVGMMLEQQVRVEKQVVEVEGVRRAQALLQALVDAGAYLGGRVVSFIGEDAGHDELVFRRVDVQFGHDVFHQALRIIVIIDGEALGKAQALAVGAQDAHAHAVEGAHPHAAGGGAHEAAEALAHLGGGLVGERDGQDLPRLDAQVFEHMGDAIREHARLAAAGAREDEQRSFGAEHRFALGAVEGIEVYHPCVPLPFAVSIPECACIASRGDAFGGVTRPSLSRGSSPAR